MTIFYAFLFTVLGVGIGVGLMCILFLSRDNSADIIEENKVLHDLLGNTRAQRDQVEAQNQMLLEQLRAVRLVLEPGRAEIFQDEKNG